MGQALSILDDVSPSLCVDLRDLILNTITNLSKISIQQRITIISKSFTIKYLIIGQYRNLVWAIWSTSLFFINNISHLVDKVGVSCLIYHIYDLCDSLLFIHKRIVVIGLFLFHLLNLGLEEILPFYTLLFHLMAFHHQPLILFFELADFHIQLLICLGELSSFFHKLLQIFFMLDIFKLI